MLTATTDISDEPEANLVRHFHIRQHQTRFYLNNAEAEVRKSDP